MATNLIKPELFASLVREAFKGKVRIAPMAVDLGEIEGFREIGETINFPKWNLLCDKVQKLKKGDTIDTQELTQTNSKAEIEWVGQSVTVYDIEQLTAMGKQLEEGARQVSEIFARHIDNRLAEEARKTLLKKQVADMTKISGKDLNEALGLFGDEQDVTDMAAIVIHSSVAPAFYTMPEFVSSALTHTTDNNGIVMNGCIGYFRGIPVIMTDKTTDVNSKKVTYIIKKNSLGYKFKREELPELERIAKQKRTDIVSDMIFAVKLLKDDGVVTINE